MSGGHYEYAYHHIENLAANLELSQERHDAWGDLIPPARQVWDPYRVRFKQLLELVAKAAYAVEWVDSQDSGPGDDHQAIQDVFDFASKHKLKKPKVKK